MTYRCNYCNAFYWSDERNVSHPYQYTKCCNKGKIILPPISQPTPYMRRMLMNNANDIQARLFNRKARIFNNKLSFASITYNDVHQNLEGIPSMRIQGQIYHNIGTIHPADNRIPQFLQCFFYEHENNHNNLNAEEWVIMQQILQEIRENNSFFLSVLNVSRTEAGLQSELPS